jgi:hypothetical protein
MIPTHCHICDENCTFFEVKKDDAQKEYLYCIKAKCNIHYSWRMMSAVNGCASHSSHQSERELYWRDLFVSDLRSLITWDAKRGNPELFKASNLLDNHYNKFTVEQHDNQIRKDERDAVLEIVAEVINNRITYLREEKPEYYTRFGEKNNFNELQATEGELLLLRIREELRQKADEQE